MATQNASLAALGFGTVVVYLLIAFGVFLVLVLITRWIFRIDRIVELLESIAAELRRAPAPGRVSATPRAQPTGQLPGEVAITEDNIGEIAKRLGKRE